MSRINYALLALALLFVLFASPVKAQAGPTFYYVVTTVDAKGFESPFSAQATASFSQGQSKVSLSWNAATVPANGNSVAGYNVYRSTTSGTGYVKVNTTLVTGVSYADPFVQPNAPTGLTAPTS